MIILSFCGNFNPLGPGKLNLECLDITDSDDWVKHCWRNIWQGMGICRVQKSYVYNVQTEASLIYWQFCTTDNYATNRKSRYVFPESFDKNVQ